MVYSIKQKIDICLMAEANPAMTQQDLAVWAKDRYGSVRPPSQTTISRILAKKNELIALKEHEYKLIRRRRLSNPLLRKVLVEWIYQSVWCNIPITAPIIRSTASNLWREIPENLRQGTGDFSYKWCSQFLSKMNISLNNIENELYKRLKVWTVEERDQLKDLLKGFDPKKIFTLTEVLISNDLPLDKLYYADSSDFITCMLCVNVDGSEKLDPLIIGRYENYPSFEGKSSIKASNKHCVSYHSNRKKWLTSTLFYDWLSVLDKRLALTNRHILLILDDSASHRVVNIKLHRIRLLYTSSTTNFLPMDWGVANDFRLTYRIQQYQKLINKQIQNKNSILTKEEQTFTMAETLDLVKESWTLIPDVRIKSAWKQSGILPESISKSFIRQRLFDDQLETELLHLINQFKVNEKWETLSLLDLTVEQKINKTFLSNMEIVQSCIVDNYDDFDHSNGLPKRAPFSHTLGQGLPKLRRLGERLNSTADIEVVDFDPINFDFDSIELDGQILNDLNSTYNTTAPSTVQLQPMSELAPFTCDDINDVEVINSWTDVLDTDTPRSTETASLTFYPPIIANSSPGNPQVQYSQLSKKLSIIVSFINLAEKDETMELSESTMNELRFLQQKFLHQCGNFDAPPFNQFI